jgi:Spy/CpxP family protein refolding chaperone
VTENGLDLSALRAVAELLQAAERNGIGVTFVPDAEGWRIGHMVGHGGGDLVAGYHLTDTARAALRPLEDLAAEREQARRERERR